MPAASLRKRHWFPVGMALLLGVVWGLTASAGADSNPLAVFTETFATYDYADGARTTAWWDRAGGRLMLRPPDAAPLRGHPVVTSAPAGGMLIAWTEDRGAGPYLWAQQLDARGNRLGDADRQLYPWAGDRWSSDIGDRALSLAAISDGAWLLAWSDDNGVWISHYTNSTAGEEPVTQLAETANTAVQARCGQSHCAVIWQEAEHSQIKTFDGSMKMVGSSQLPGSIRASWSLEGDVWLVWQDNGTHMAQRFDPTLNPRLPTPLTLPDDGSEITDVAGDGTSLLVLTLNPTRLIQLAPATSAIELATYPAATAARLLTTSDDVLVLLQTTDTSSLWLWQVRPVAAAHLLRLGLPGWEARLGDAATTNDAAVAVVWLEAGKLFGRRWLPGGWSSWRHEVSPAYTPSEGWISAEGLGHSLDINPPTQAVTSVRLQADMILNGGSVQFFVSNQGPKQWQPITPSAEVIFATSGTRLRWYARLRRSAWGTTPEIRQITLSYHYQHVLYWPHLMVGGSQ